MVVIFIIVVITALNVMGYSNDESFHVVSLIGMLGIRIKPVISTLSEFLTNLRFSSENLSLLSKEYSKLNALTLHNSKLQNSNFKNFQSITFKNVCFTYNKKNDFTISNINFEINKGECIGIVGESGSGKSTLMDLLLGLIRPTTGDIIYNNITMDNFTNETFPHFAYFPQHCFLVDGTISENVALGVDPSKIDYELLEYSLKNVNLLRFTRDLPLGLETMLSPSGSNLSGGQIQRICLARLFYFNRDVILLDEATSALDTKNESLIIDNLLKFKGDKTIIIITHRHSTVMNCNKIFMLDSGRIIKSGPPKEVLI
jgi:ABC-type bacteriocin/lantibiotic exporter with double-glycine peptidase domain